MRRGSPTTPADSTTPLPPETDGDELSREDGGQGPDEQPDEQGPLRTCVACRKQAVREELLRFVAGPDGQVFFDGHGKLPGRGAHTCPEPDCVRRAAERRGFDRSFRRTVRAGNPEGLVQAVQVWHRNRLVSLLGLARRAGRLIAGGDEVLRGLNRGQVKLLVLAADLSAARRGEMSEVARRAGVPGVVTETMESLGRAVGRPPTGILGVAEGPQLVPLRLAAQRLAKFGGALPTQEMSGTLGEAG